MAAELKMTGVFKNPDKLSSLHLDAILKHFGRVAEDQAELARQAVEYIVDGGSEDILLKLGGSREIAEALVIHSQLAGAQSNWHHLYEMATRERATIFWPQQRPPISVWIRMSQVFAALFRASNVTTTYKNFPDWLTVLFGLVIGTAGNKRNIKGGKSISAAGSWSLAEWREIFKAANVPDEALVEILLSSKEREVFFNTANTYAVAFQYYRHNDFVTQVPGWQEYLSEHEEAVRQRLKSSDSASRIYAVQELAKTKYCFQPIVDVLVDIATSSSKSARESAIEHLAPVKSFAKPYLEAALREGDATQRHEAAVALWRLEGQDVVEMLTHHRINEKSERVQQTIDKLLAAPKSTSDEPFELTLPPLELETGAFPFPEEGKVALHEYFAKSHRDAMANFDRMMAEYEAATDKKHHYKPHKPKEVEPGEVDRLIAFLQGEQGPVRISSYTYRTPPFGEWFAPPQVKLVHVVRLAAGFSQLNIEQRDHIWWPNREGLDLYRSRCPKPFGLRDLDAAIADVFKCERGKAAWGYLINNTRYWTFCDWEPDAIWPLFAEMPQILRDVLNPGFKGIDQYRIDGARETAFRVLAKFPKLPPEFIPLLWDIALGESKSSRLLAQNALATVAGKTGQIIVALGDGKQTIRAAAAEWLGRLGDAAAIDPLKEAFRAEKQESVKGTIMAALDALGADVDEFLDRKKLLAESEAGLKKKRPKGMEWVPLAQLPKLHWQDNGKPVDSTIVEWWIVQLIQQKSPVPGPLLRRYLSMCKPDETAQLAQFVLRAWIGRDTQTLSHEEASDLARKETDKLWTMYSKHQYWVDHYKGDKENLYQEQYAKTSSQCLHSAINEKGMLAIVAAVGDRECVRLCEQYLRQWFGQKLAQCKCLVEVLAWIEHPGAVQVLLSISNRFRTKAIREAATQHVQALAERQGWTLDELADRTIPDGGFERATDEQGRPIGDEATLILDYGPRKFLVRLSDDLEPIISTEEGKTVKSPPAPGKTDDPEKAKAAKKAFTDAKKTIKDVVKRQTERFYEGLCTQRTWRFGDWRTYLAQHPVVGRLVSRLVWAAFDATDDGETFRSCFRLLDDGSLTNEADEEVTFTPETTLRLAHTCNVPGELETVWLQHLTDYDVEPLFAQFNRPTYELPEAKAKETSITDFEGHMLTTFKLRGKATKLGYLRGQAEDGGVFMCYHKPFNSLGIEAVINFSGSMLPEQDIPAALHSLEFHRLTTDNSARYFGSVAMPLGKIPAVLLSECYNDMKQIAADGSGFAADWKTKSYF